MDWLWLWLIIEGIILYLATRGEKSHKRVSATAKVLRSRSSSLKERKGSRQLKVVNDCRRRRGLRLLRAYYELDKMARDHSSYMAKHRTCNHTGFAHRTAQVRRLTGSSYVGENCFRYPAREYNTHVAGKLMQVWMKSPGYRANLMNSRYTKIGMGIATEEGYVYATQIFTD